MPNYIDIPSRPQKSGVMGEFTHAMRTIYLVLIVLTVPGAV